VPEHVAVPLVQVAVVGAAVKPYPVLVTAKVLPVHEAAVVIVPVTVAAVPPLLNDVRYTVPVPDSEPPVIVPPVELTLASPVAVK